MAHEIGAGDSLNDTVVRGAIVHLLSAVLLSDELSGLFLECIVVLFALGGFARGHPVGRIMRKPESLPLYKYEP